MKSGMRILSLGAMVLVTWSGLALAASSKMNREDFRCAVRGLWDDHVVWTRVYVMDALNDLPAKEETAQRLLKNQTEIGNAIKPFYGNEAGDKLTALLKDHIMIATEVVDAVKTNAAADKKDDAVKRWKANADEIGAFLGGANPKYWHADDMKSMMQKHLDLLTDEVTAQAGKDWKADIIAFDKSDEQILKMADMIAIGIVNQFPDHFKGQSLAGPAHK